MAHSRDVRTHASEIKFVVSNELAQDVRQWARRHLAADPHGSGPHQDEYHITTMYFDTAGLDVFHRRGSFGRSKYRIRRYGDEGSVFLERKLREPDVLAKRRTQVPVAALERLTSARADSWHGHWFHRRLVARRLLPVCQVSYQRSARVLVLDGETVRLTVDAQLAAQPTERIDFANGAGTPFLPDRSIVELKFRGVLPALFRRLVEEFALNPEPASKYRLGLAAVRPSRPMAVGAQGGGAEAYA